MEFEIDEWRLSYTTCGWNMMKQLCSCHLIFVCVPLVFGVVFNLSVFGLLRAEATHVSRVSGWRPFRLHMFQGLGMDRLTVTLWDRQTLQWKIVCQYMSFMGQSSTQNGGCFAVFDCQSECVRSLTSSQKWNAWGLCTTLFDSKTMRNHLLWYFVYVYVKQIIETRTTCRYMQSTIHIIESYGTMYHIHRFQSERTSSVVHILPYIQCHIYIYTIIFIYIVIYIYIYTYRY